MKKLTFYLSIIMMMSSLITYICLAAWVVQDGFDTMSTRLEAVAIGICWMFCSFLAIVGCELDVAVAEALIEGFEDGEED